MSIQLNQTVRQMLAGHPEPIRTVNGALPAALEAAAPVVDAYTALGARACHPIYNAVDPATHYPAPPDPRFAGECAFLGAGGGALPQARSAAARDALYPGGNAWEDKPKSAKVRYVGYVSTRDHNALNCTPRTVLNINRASMARYGFSPPTRVFEAAGAGACLITDAWEGIEFFLEPEREVLVAEDGDAVAAILGEQHGQSAMGPQPTLEQKLEV